MLTTTTTPTGAEIINAADAPALERFNAAADLFLRVQASSNTTSNYGRAIRRYADWLAAEGISPAEVGLGDLIRWRDTLAASLAPASANVILSAVRSLYRFLAEQGVVDRNPTAGLRTLRTEDGTTRSFLGAEEAARLLAAPNGRTLIGKRDRAILGLLAVNGLREVEVHRADVGDLRRIDGFDVLRVRGKGGRLRDAKIRPDVLRALTAYLEARGEPQGDEALLVGTNGRAGERISTRTIRDRVGLYLERTGLRRRGISGHSLRHTAVTNAILAGASLHKAQDLAGHADPRTTSRYFHHVDRLRSAAVDVIPYEVPA